METRKQKRRSLRLTLLLLLLTAIILLSSSYAWFTANQTVTVDELQVNVAAQNGLQISADGSKFSAMINQTDLSTAATTYSTLVNQLPTSLAPVSTSGNVSDGKLDMYLGTVTAGDDGQYRLTATKETDTTGTTGNYIAFDMFLKVEKTTKIKLTANSGVKASGEASTGIENAARVAFINQGYMANGSALSSIQGLKAGTLYLWEPNYDTHTPAAVSHAIGTYGKTLADFGQTSTPTTTITGVDAISYDGVKAEIGTGIKLAETTATANTTYFATVTPTYKTKSSFGAAAPGVEEVAGENYLQIFNLEAGITKVRVYFWIEGQDYDCENDASGGNIALNIQLSIMPDTTT